MTFRHKHYGLAGLLPVCGSNSTRLTHVPKDVTCKRCKNTIMFKTEFLTKPYLHREGSKKK